MGGYQIEVSLTALCPSCGEALAPGNYMTESRVTGDVLQWDSPFERKDRRVFITPCKQCFVHRSEVEASNKMQAAAPELYEALKQTIALAWQDTREAKFDSTVLFGLGYDFDGWELFRSEIHTPAGSWAVWNSNGKYSAYGGPDGGMWFEKFDTSEAAEEAVLREIDRLCPSFPTAVARAALSKATGGEK